MPHLEKTISRSALILCLLSILTLLGALVSGVREVVGHPTLTAR